MATADFFRARLDEMIDLNHPLAILRDRFPWSEMEAVLSPFFARQERGAHRVAVDDMFGSTVQIAGGARPNAGSDTVWNVLRSVAVTRSSSPAREAPRSSSRWSHAPRRAACYPQETTRWRSPGDCRLCPRNVGERWKDVAKSTGHDGVAGDCTKRSRVRWLGFVCHRL